MGFGKDFLSQFDERTAMLLDRADRLTDQGVKGTVRADAWVVATDCACAQERWLAWFPAFFFSMWAMEECGSKYLKRLLQYSNDFLRFGEERFTQVLAAGRYVGYACDMYVKSYSYLYSFFKEYYQIGDGKIEELFEKYGKTYQTWGSVEAEASYRFTRMCWAMEVGDPKETVSCLRRVMELEKESGRCYVCDNFEVAGALLCLGREQEALHRIGEIISNDGIPEAWYDDFRNCENGVACRQYGVLVYQAFWLKNPELFLRLAQEYHDEILECGDEITDYTDLLVLAVTDSTDVRREWYLQEQIAVTLDEIQDKTPRRQLAFYLCSWAYLEMLRRCGMEQVELGVMNLPVRPVSGHIWETARIQEYLLGEADLLGKKFDQARAAFHYEELKRLTLTLMGKR